MSETRPYSKSYQEYMAGIPKIKADEFSEIVDNSMITLSLDYARQYQQNPKNFLTCFIKFPSIRTACSFIVIAYTKSGAFKECQETGKDFSEFAGKQPISARWQRVLADILLILFSIIHTN